MKKHIITFKNPRLEQLVVDHESAKQALNAMASNGLWEYKGQFYNGSAIDAVTTKYREKRIELPEYVEKPVSKETLRAVANQLRELGFQIQKQY